MSGPLGSLLVTTTEAISVPAKLGENVTPKVQDVLAAKLAGQPFEITAKSAPFGPDGEATEIPVSKALPVLVKVTVMPEVVVPKTTGVMSEPKVILEGFNVTEGDTKTVALAWLELALVPAELKAATT